MTLHDANQADAAALAFVRADPDEETPARFPRLAHPPSDLVNPAEPKTQQSPPLDDETKMQFAEILELLRNNNEAVEGMRKGLLDEGGTLDRMGKNWEDKLSILASHVSNEVGALRDLITNDRLEAGRKSEPAIKAELPVSVLVVDDDPILCRTIQGVLQDAGVTAHAATGADDALSLLRGELPFDVVLVDLTMPRNGKGLAATIIAEHPRVNVLLMSGNAGLAATQALSLRAHGALGKPFDSNDALVLAVIRCAEHRRLRVHGSPAT